MLESPWRLALILGTLFAGRLARPVGSLADAADRLAAGDFDAPLEPSGCQEVTRVSDAFDQMRKALRARLAELEEANLRLEEANRELEDRQERLVVLQAELVQRDRLASAGRLLAQLAHEIRNPIASIRNCLEVLRRRTADEPEAQEFADMAIDELLRMHELTEQMLDVHRPRDPENSSCDVTQVAQEVANLLEGRHRPGEDLECLRGESGWGRGQGGSRFPQTGSSQPGTECPGGHAGRGSHRDRGRGQGDGAVMVEVLDRGPGDS